MSNTYTQIHIHSVFAVKNRGSFISPSWDDQLFKYMTSIIQANGHKLLAINGMPDHVHILFGLRPEESISHLMQEVKRSSSLWINKNHLSEEKFSWQEGFGAFTYSKSQLDYIENYIWNQKEHHLRQNFLEEYRDLLKEYGVEYNENYLFHPIE